MERPFFRRTWVLVLIGVAVLLIRPVSVMSCLEPVMPLMYLGLALNLICIAALFLLVDFDTIQTAVEKQLPRKYEWIAAFGLAFSVIWLFLKVLDLILKLTGKDSSND